LTAAAKDAVFSVLKTLTLHFTRKFPWSEFMGGGWKK